jgi:hypothetical protein
MKINISEKMGARSNNIFPKHFKKHDWRHSQVTESDTRLRELEYYSSEKNKIVKREIKSDCFGENANA